MGHHGFGRAQEVPDDLGHVPFGPHFQVLRAEHLARAHGKVSSHLSSPFRLLRGWGKRLPGRDAAIYIKDKFGSSIASPIFDCFD